MAPFNVAIIGGGLSGLALALALNQESISCTIYEAHKAPLDTGGGLMMGPNGLKVLKAIGVYGAIRETAWEFDNVYVQFGLTGKIMEQVEYGNVKKYGMRALHPYRFVVLEQLLAKVRSKGIPIQFSRRFSHVVRETEDAVTWQFTDGTEESASLMIGADGIHSSVRKYVAPGIKPIYGGVLSLVAAIPTAQLGLPAEELKDLNNPKNKHPLPAGIVVPQLGGPIIVPETKNGDEVMISAVRRFPDELDNWADLGRDKDRLRAMFRENAEKFPQVVQNAVKDIPSDKLIVWPGYGMPRLDHWTSVQNGGLGKGRVVILGDAAHAIPPSAGQGVNQAFEDIYTFAGVLGKVGDKSDLKELQAAFSSWQRWRQGRVDIVTRLVKQMELRRLPAAAQASQGVTDPESLKASMNEDYDAIFKVNYAEVLEQITQTA